VSRLYSLCLLGVRCRYDGESKQNPDVLEQWRREGGLALCPEQLGGLATPRRPATLVGADGCGVLDGKAAVLDEEGRDVTRSFQLGARECARLARLAGVTCACLKGGSPSCGVVSTSIDWKRSPGEGVTAALLRRMGIEIIEVD
jgi:uncharacterized protein YbbK (DUF523 family)